MLDSFIHYDLLKKASPAKRGLTYTPWVLCFVVFVVVSGCGFFDAGQSTPTPEQGKVEENAADAQGREQRAFADTVYFPTDAQIKEQGALNSQYIDTSRAVDGVRGRGRYEQSLNVYSLGAHPSGSIIVGWSDRVIKDRPGTDLAVFENPFFSQAAQRVMIEPVAVSVSVNGKDWVSFPHALIGVEQTFDRCQNARLPQFNPCLDGVWRPDSIAADARVWEGWAGLRPVWYNEEQANWSDHGFDPLNTFDLGGDGFDLQDLPPDHPVTKDVLELGVCFVRLQAAPVLLQQNLPAVCLAEEACTAAYFPEIINMEGGSYADIDGVYAGSFEKDQGLCQWPDDPE